MIDAAEAASDQPPWWEAEVVAYERRTIDVAVLHVRSTTPLEYLPGQAISLESERRPRLWRWYSPANAPRSDGVLELHVKARDGGPVSTALLRRTQVGDALRLGPPVGHLALDTDSDRDLLLVAGGTGLAPLKALIDQVAQQGPPRRVDLFVGARTEDGLYDRADLRRLEQEHAWLTVTCAVSHEKGSSVEHGDIGDVVLRHGPWTSRDAYVAGNPAMVEDTVTRLHQHGVPMARIRTEVFAASRPSPTVDGKVTE
jgi:NAD(P)H-flavin reductase